MSCQGCAFTDWSISTDVCWMNGGRRADADGRRWVCVSTDYLLLRWRVQVIMVLRPQHSVIPCPGHMFTEGRCSTGRADHRAHMVWRAGAEQHECHTRTL